MESQNELISLFDYLGRAAGSDLGKKVATVATRLGEPMSKRLIQNTRYKGEVILYRRSFLEEYFTKKISEGEIEPSLGDLQNYSL